MAVVIRMKRTGRRNRPCYRISVADSRAPRDGSTIETLGTYDPIAPKPELQLEVDLERAQYWLSQGALPSETVGSIFRRLNLDLGGPPKKRDRAGRKRGTATKRRRMEAQQERAERKSARRTERRRAPKAAASA